MSRMKTLSGFSANVFKVHFLVIRTQTFKRNFPEKLEKNKLKLISFSSLFLLSVLGNYFRSFADINLDANDEAL